MTAVSSGRRPRWGWPGLLTRDPLNGWLVVDAASPAKADEVLKLLFKSVDKLPLEALHVAQSPVAAMTEPMTPPPVPAAPKRLVRSRDDRWLGGVCGGTAAYLGVDANLVRLIVVLGTIFGFGSLALAYIVAWILMPEE